MNEEAISTSDLIEEILISKQRAQELERSGEALKQAEAALREQKEFIETVLDNLTDHLIIIDSISYKILGANKTCLDFYGLDKDSVIGKSCYALTHDRANPCSPPNDICPLQDTLKTGKPSSAEHIHYDVTGNKLYVEVSTLPIKSSGGDILKIIHISRNITERKQMEGKLRESESKYRSLASTSDSIYLVDRDCRYLFANDNYLVRFSDKRDSIIGQKFADFHNAEFSIIFSNYVRCVFETGNSCQNEYLGERSGRYMLQTFSPVKDASGDVTSVTVVAKDITDRKQAENALDEERRQLQQALDEIRTLRGIVPICAYCKKIRDDEGYWNQVEQYVSEHTEAKFSHGICPACFEREMKGINGNM